VSCRLLSVIARADVEVPPNAPQTKSSPGVTARVHDEFGYLRTCDAHATVPSSCLSPGEGTAKTRLVTLVRRSRCHFSAEPFLPSTTRPSREMLQPIFAAVTIYGDEGSSVRRKMSRSSRPAPSCRPTGRSTSDKPLCVRGRPEHPAAGDPCPSSLTKRLREQGYRCHEGPFLPSPAPSWQAGDI
jgi:hypothetical protein